MFAILTSLLGGVGLFLLGMILMSDGLKAAAGRALQRILERSTGTPLRAFASGVGLTALVQSSSATTLATIGFVSAGLLSFTGALGVIIGANVGTTSTGWIVALLGLRFNFGMIALPFIGVGALLRLLSTGRKAHLGMALAGFGLIFVGIDVLRAGMGDLALRIDLGAFSAEALGGQLVLVLVGVVMTVLLQSSSAAVALTLTAVHSGAIGLVEAAFLVIGQNLGTTVKAGLVAIGASIPARRTAAAHILFNVFAGVVAFVGVGPLLALGVALADQGGVADPAVALTVYHTAFNLISAALVLPFLRPFARLVTRLVPEREPALTRHLDRSLLELPEVAVGAAGRTVSAIARVAFSASRDALLGRPRDRAAQMRLEEAHDALHQTHRFLGSIRMGRDAGEVYGRRLALLHAGDHLARLIHALRDRQPEEAAMAAVRPTAEAAAAALEHALAWLDEGEDGPAAAAALEESSAAAAEERRQRRADLLRRTAAGLLSPDEAQDRLEAMREVDRVLYHAWRAVYHLTAPPDEAPFQPSPEEVEVL